MHVVIWTSGNGHYATPSRQIVEVIPVVEAQPLPSEEPWVRGSFNYRGKLITLVDMTRMLHGHSTEHLQRARILVVHTASSERDGPTLAGLLVESVLGGLPLECGQAPENVHSQREPSFLGATAVFEAATVRLTDPSHIVVPLAELDLS